MITFFIAEQEGSRKPIDVPGDINLNVMEVLKGSGYPIEATCGGMALCATCHVEIIEGFERLDPHTDAELDMLDTLPSICATSRLACQIRVNEKLQGVVVALKG